MLAPLLIAALLTAAASEEEGDAQSRTDALRKKLFPLGRQVPTTLLSINDFDRVNSFIKQALLHLGFPESYAHTVSGDLFDDWMNMDSDLPDTLDTPWYIRFDRVPVVPREPHEPKPTQGDLAAAPFFRRQVYKLLRQIPHFEDEYFEQLADALTDGWLHQDLEPRWDTHSRFGLRAQALYWKYRSLGWPHYDAQSKYWALCDESEQDRLIAAKLPSYWDLKRKADLLIEVMLEAGFPEAYAQSAAQSLIWFRLGEASTHPISVGTRGTWSRDPDPERARFEQRIFTHMTRALKRIIPLTHPDAEKVAHKMAKDWVHDSMPFY